MKVLVDYKRIVNERENKGYNLVGSQGFCEVNNELIRKIYFSPKHSSLLDDLSKYKSDMIAFPIEYIYDLNNQGWIVGEIMKYFRKESIGRSICEDTIVENFINSYLRIIKEIKKFPEIRMEDLVSPNILYSNSDGFTLIDTSEWIVDDYDHTNLNIRRLEFELIERIFNNILGIFPSTLDKYDFCRRLNKYGRKGKELWKLLYACLDDETKLLETIDLYRKIFNEDIFGPIKTLGDMKKYTKKLKKG